MSDATPAATARSAFGIAHWRLGTRLVVVSVLLLLLLQAAAFVALRASVQRNATKALQEQLAVGERIWQRLLDQRATKLAQGASLLAADYGFRSALGSGDRDTIASALENHGARINAGVSALLNGKRELEAVIVRSAAGATDAATGEHAHARAVLQGLATRLVDGSSIDARTSRGASTVAMVGEHPYQFVVAPVRAPLVIGWVAMGFELDRALLDELHAVSGMHGTLRVKLPDERGRAIDAAAADRVLATTLPANGIGPQLDRHVALAVAGAGGVTLELHGSLDEAVAPFMPLQWTMGLIALIGVALFAAASAWSARRVTRPLVELVGASLRLGRGEYDTPVAQVDASGEVRELATAFDSMRRNIAQQQHKIRQLAYWDTLTGLPNRAQFLETLRDAIAERDSSGHSAGETLAVVMLDLDRFKHVNSVLGFDHGDRLLQGAAARLQVVVRDHDTLARLGGDEFALLLRRADAVTAQEVAARIGHAFETPLSIDDESVDFSAGIGIAAWPAHGDDAHTLLEHAELAMVAAKKRGAGGVQVFDPTLENASAQSLSLLSQLRRAVDSGELRLYLQPKIDVASGAVCGAEALVRWQHPQRGLLAPFAFIPFAEQTGFIRRITLWIFDEVARHQAALASMGVARVSLNLSTRDLLDTELPEKLDAILARHQAQPRGLCLEITESAVMDDPTRAQAILDRLAQRGFDLSIDDFGTGYSSLAYLKRLPVHELKIDKSFVMAMEHDGNDAKIVRSTIDLAHGLGLAVVAEGVENAAILEGLEKLGCDEAQGFHFAKPLPVDDFAAWVARHAGMARRHRVGASADDDAVACEGRQAS